jgi:uncharacterized protein YdhG (YjbR/CyaY superfamily)
MKAQSIDEYILQAPEDLRERLYQLHSTIQKAALGSGEAIKWSMPAYSFKRILVMWAIFKNHTGFYPTPSVIDAFADKLKPYKSAKGSIQFPHHQELPFSLIKEMVLFRVEEAVQEDVKWKENENENENENGNE